jgi:hypothetical protein
MENIKKYNEFLNEWKISFKKSKTEKEVQDILKNLDKVKDLRYVEGIIVFRYNNKPYSLVIDKKSNNPFKHTYDVDGSEIDTRMGEKLYDELKKINKNI